MVNELANNLLEMRNLIQDEMVSDLPTNAPFLLDQAASDLRKLEMANVNVETLREVVKKALTWEGRLNEASQLLEQGVSIEPSKIKIAVHAERRAAIAILEETE